MPTTLPRPADCRFYSKRLRPGVKTKTRSVIFDIKITQAYDFTNDIQEKFALIKLLLR
jgi:hypothetical protein